MSDHYYLNEDHTYRPCSFVEWAEQFENLRGSKHVANDIVNGNRISTIWLGLDHNFLRGTFGGDPLVFETMVFTEEVGGSKYCERHSTWDEAVEGHSRAIEWVNRGCPEDEV